MRYLVTSDIHLGHPRTSTQHVSSTFLKQILSKENTTLDIIFISGDIFDRLIDTNSKDLLIIIDLFNRLLNYCNTNNILLRVLHGTPSHDQNQSTILVKLNEIRATHKQVDLKYFNILDIEYIESLNKYILYIPDEWVNDHTKLEEQIQYKLNLYNIQQVDIAILHGQFQYQTLGKKYTGFFFQEKYFLNLVKGFIHVGHYHTYSTYDRILANGSLERLAHGEESPKGHIVVTDSSYSFIENPNAFIYKTITVNSNTTLTILDSKICKYPKSSYIRLLLSKDHPFNFTFDTIRARYQDYNIKKVIKEHGTELNTVTYILEDEELDLSSRSILEGNLHETLYRLITEKIQLTSIETSKLVKYLDYFKGDLIGKQDTI